MPGWTVTINTFTGPPGGTGHVNISFEGPGYPRQTWGNNITNGDWRVQDEGDSWNRSDRTSASFEVSYGQFNSLISFITSTVNGSNNNYGLFGLNCVDFVRDALDVMGMGDQVAGFLANIGAAINIYATITDWMHNNGLDFVADGLGQFFGNMGELGGAIADAAVWAWNSAANIVDASWNFVTTVGQNIMAFGNYAWNLIMGVFSGFGKVLDGEVMETVDPRRPPVDEKSDEDDLMSAMVALDQGSGVEAPWTTKEQANQTSRFDDRAAEEFGGFAFGTPASVDQTWAFA